MIKKYHNGEVTIVWKPDMCIHSTLCWKGLGEVFNPKVRPWINAQGASTEAIIEQVKKCPSQAISYYLNGQEDLGKNENPENSESQVKITVTPNGPLLVDGKIHIIDNKGNKTIKHDTTALCRCGSSQNKPFCDGSHVDIHFKD